MNLQVPPFPEELQAAMRAAAGARAEGAWDPVAEAGAAAAAPGALQLGGGGGGGDGGGGSGQGAPKLEPGYGCTKEGNKW